MTIELALALTASIGGQDTLLYTLAVNPAGRSVSVEARITTSGTRRLVLNAPPATGPARTSVTGVGATDDQGRSLFVREAGATFSIELADVRAVRFRYRVEFMDRWAESSTGSGFDGQHLYAVTRSVFVAPDPTAYRKTSRTFPVVRVTVLPPAGWHVAAAWPEAGPADSAGGVATYAPTDGDELLGATIAMAPDFRLYGDTAGGVAWRLAIRGRRYFTDSALVALIHESLQRGAAALGPVGARRVLYTSELGRKGRVSGSLQGTAAVGLVWEPSEILDIARSHDTFHETLHLWFGGAMEAERWWTEGVTDYYAARLYAEWKGRPDDLAHLMYQSHRNYMRIGHNTRMTMAEENRRRLGGDNTELLIYRKGMLAGLLLDAAIRRSTNGRRTLDDASRDLLRLAGERRSRMIREPDIREALRRVGGRDVERVWDRVVAGRELLGTSEIAQALRDVTGRDLQPPPLATKRGKTLRR